MASVYIDPPTHVIVACMFRVATINIIRYHRNFILEQTIITHLYMSSGLMYDYCYLILCAIVMHNTVYIVRATGSTLTLFSYILVD